MSFLFFFLFRTLFVKARLFFLFLSLRHCIFSTKSSQDGGQTGTSSSSVAPGKKCTWQLSGTHSRKSHPAEKKARQQAWILVLFFVFFFHFSCQQYCGVAPVAPAPPKPWRGGDGKAGQAFPPNLTKKHSLQIYIYSGTKTPTHVHITHRPTICTQNES